MLDPKFFAIDEFRPSIPVLYDLMTVQRIFYYSDGAKIARWGHHNGALSEVLLPRVGEANHIAVFRDLDSAIICFEGTADFAQLLAQAGQSALQTNPHFTGQVGSYWSWYFNINRDRVVNALAGLSANATILLCGHSLGSAAALMFANYFKRDFLFNISCVVAFGCMRVGDAAFAAGLTMPLVRWANEGDLVTQVPPSHFSTAIIGDPFQQHYRYVHAHDAWLVDVNGIYTRVGFLSSGSLLEAAVISAIYQGIFDPSIEGIHYYNEYLRRLRLNQFEQGGVSNFDSLSLQINAELDAIDQGVNPVPPHDVPEVIPERRWVIPDIVVPDSPDTPTVPSHDLGKTFEVRTLSHVLFTYGGAFAMANVYRGRDRRMLQTLVKVGQDIIARDVRATDPKHTQRISSRQIMFPAGGTPDKLVALNLVITQATALLAQTK